MFRWLLIFISFGFSTVVAAIPPINIQVFNDVNKTATIESLLQNPSKIDWKPANDNSNFGYTKSRYWLRFEALSKIGSKLEDYFLEIPFSYLQTVTLYTTVDKSILSEATQGMGLYASDSTTPPVTGGFVFPIGDSTDVVTKTYYLSVESDFPLSVPIRFLSQKELTNQQVPRNLLLGIFFGALILAFGFNAFLASAVKTKSYLYYCLFVASIAMLFLAHERISTQYLWPNSKSWASSEIHVFGAFAFLFYGLFVRSFLQTFRRTPLLDNILLVLMVVSSIRGALFGFFPSQWLGIIGQMSVVLGNFLILIMAGVCFFKKARSAQYFLMSSLVFNAGYVLFVLQKSNVIFVGDFVEYAPHVGVLAEALLLSFALGDHIRHTKNELKQNQAEMMFSEKMAALGRMAASISHEINNPLAIIGFNAEMIDIQTDRANPSISKIREYGQAIERTVYRISKIIKSLQVVARDATNDPITYQKLNEILEEVSIVCQGRFRNGQVGFHIKPVSDDILVPCRGPEISQILINLLNNAFDAVQSQTEKVVEVDWKIEKQKIFISVIDSGPGVPPEMRARIYEPFFTSKPVGKGTGLGLSISRTLIQNHGGQLWLDETDEKTKFTFDLPVVQSVNQETEIRSLELV